MRLLQSVSHSFPRCKIYTNNRNKKDSKKDSKKYSKKYSKKENKKENKKEMATPRKPSD